MQDDADERPSLPRRSRNTSHPSPFISRISKREVSETSHKPPAVCPGGGEFTHYLSRIVFPLPFSALARVPDSG